MLHPTLKRLLGALALLLGIALLLVPLTGFLVLPTTALAAPVANLPTTTPMPPTPEPSATPAPSATPVPSATPASSATPEDPPEERRRPPSPTPTMTSTAPPPSATPETVISITDIAVEKTADEAVTMPGGLVRFRIRLFTVTGADVATDVVVRDAVPDVFEVIDLASSKGDIVVAGQEVTGYPSTLAPGEEVIITVTVRVRAGVQPGTVVNTARITTSTSTDFPGNNTSSTSVEIKVPVEVKIVPPQLPSTSDPLAAHQAFLMLLPWTLVGLLLLSQGAMLLWRGRLAMIPVPIAVMPMAGRLQGWLGRLRLPGHRVADGTVPPQEVSGEVPGRNVAGVMPPPNTMDVLDNEDAAAAADGVLGPPLPEPGPSGPLPPLRPKDRRQI